MFAHLASSEKTKQANQPIYQAVPRPHSYRPYGVDSTYVYDDTYRRYDDAYDTYGAYPSTFDGGAQRLHLSGGIYRPYDYDDSYGYNAGYKPYSYDNTYKYYDNSRILRSRYRYPVTA